MRPNRSTLAILLALACLLAAPPADARGRASAPGDIVVLLVEGADVDAVAAKYRCSVLERIPGTSTYRLHAQRARKALKRMTRDRRVVAAGLSTTVRRDQSGAFPHGEAEILATGGDAAYHAQLAPGGTLELQAIPGANLFLDGRPETVVAILDTGIDAQHPAVAGALWRNEVELDGQPGVDDDGNGYVDDLNGYDFVDGDGDPSELGASGPAAGHGTFIAGLAALSSPKARVMPLRVLASDGAGMTFDAAAAVHYAVENGAKVICVSFGVSGAEIPVELRDAILAAAGPEHNAVVVAAAGNEGAEVLPYPASERGSVLVAAAVDGLAPAPFSNRGDPELDLVGWAPGAGLVSAMPGTVDAGGAYQPRYARWSGTSFAAGILSGAAATRIALAPNEDRATTGFRLAHYGTPLAPGTGIGVQINFFDAIRDLGYQATAPTLETKTTAVILDGSGVAMGSAELRTLRTGDEISESVRLVLVGLAPGSAHEIEVEAAGLAAPVQLGTAQADANGHLDFRVAAQSGFLLPVPLGVADRLTVRSGSTVELDISVDREGDEASTFVSTALQREDGTVNVLEDRFACLRVPGIAAQSIETLELQAGGLDPNAEYVLVADGVDVGQGRPLSHSSPNAGQLRFGFSTDPASSPSNLATPLPGAVGSVVALQRIELFRIDPGGVRTRVLHADLSERPN
jgi:subtilisin family serine protease